MGYIEWLLRIAGWIERESWLGPALNRDLAWADDISSRDNASRRLIGRGIRVKGNTTILKIEKPLRPSDL